MCEEQIKLKADSPLSRFAEESISVPLLPQALDMKKLRNNCLFCGKKQQQQKQQPETRMTASVLKQDPNTEKVQKNAILYLSIFLFYFFKEFEPFMCLDLVLCLAVRFGTDPCFTDKATRVTSKTRN